MQTTVFLSKVAFSLRLPLQLLIVFYFFTTALPAQHTLRVAAAADLAPVLPSLLANFEKSTGIHTEATFQASATLTTQIQNGAPFDLFLSADLSYPQRLIASGDVLGKQPTTYARGTLVLWSRKDSALSILSLNTLEDPALHRLAIASPDRAPYGRAAVALLDRLNLHKAIESKLVIAENISQAAQFAISANADAGLISLTSALTPQLATQGRYFVIPHNLYPPIEQGAVILKNSTHTTEAKRLLDYLLSPTVQSQLEQKGLTAVAK